MDSLRHSLLYPAVLHFPTSGFLNNTKRNAVYMSENNSILGHKFIKLQGIHRHCGDKTPMREYAVSLRIGNGKGMYTVKPEILVLY